MNSFPKPDLKVDWCSYEAAKYAVEHWHYSRRMPNSKLAKLGVWELGKFIGAVVFGAGATQNLVKPYGLGNTQGCELVRVALRDHVTPVSRIIAISLRMLKREMPGLRLVVSFADPEHCHVGGIYQAGGWVFTGVSDVSDEYIVNGRRLHGRSLSNKKPAHLTRKQTLALLDPDYKVIRCLPKYRYLYPLDDAMRRQIEPLRKPYPKRETCVRSADSGTPVHQPEGAWQNDPDA